MAHLLLPDTWPYPLAKALESNAIAPINISKFEGLIELVFSILKRHQNKFCIFPKQLKMS
jgi:hypothetical protein